MNELKGVPAIVAWLPCCFVAITAPASLAASLTFWRQAAHERDVAQAARLAETEQRERAEANFQKAGDAVDQMLTAVGQKDLADVPRMDAVRRTLLTRALQFYEQFLVEQGDDPAIRAQIGRAHGRVANIRMLLGDYNEAEQAFHQAVETFSGLMREYPRESDYRRDLAMAGHNLGVLYVRIGRLADAEREYRQAIPLLEQLAGREPAESSPRADLLAKYLNSLGDVLWKSGRADQAEQTYGRALDLYGVLATEFPQDTHYPQEVAGLHHNLGVLRYGVGRLTEAESSLREAAKLFDQLRAAEPHKRGPRYGQAVAHLMLANVLGDTGRPVPAEEAFHRSLEHFESLVADHPGVPG